jgi:hypothetical protein
MASLRRALKAFPGMIISLSQSESDSHIGTESVSHIETESVCHIGKGEAPRTGKRNSKKSVFLGRCLAECYMAGTNKKVFRSLV